MKGETLSTIITMMMKNIAKILLLFGGVVLIVGVIFVLQENKNNSNNDNEASSLQKEDVTDKKLEEIKTEQIVENELNNFFKLVFDKNVTKEKLEDVVKSPLDSYYIFYGKDSFVRTLLTINTSEDVTEYSKKKDEYILKLEKVLKDNFVFNIGEYDVSGEGDIVQEVSFKSFYHIKFADDFMEVRNKLLDYTDINIDDFANREPTKEELLKIYKLNVKTLEIMSSHFSDYVNENQEIKYDLIYKKIDNEISDDYFSLYLNLSGVMYDNDKDSNVKQQERDKRVMVIVNDAIKLGILDINNPYKLNS